MSCLAWHPCILAHTVVIMLLSPESRKGCSSVGSINGEREQTPKSCPTQVKTNFAVLQISVVFIFFFFLPFPFAFHTNSRELFMVLWGKKLIQLLLIGYHSCWGRWSIISHWGFLCLLWSFRTALTTVHVYFLNIFLSSPPSSSTSVYHLWFLFAPTI